MKLRIRGNSVRLRLTQGELERLRTEGSLQEAVTFGPLPSQTLCYGLAISNELSSIKANYDQHGITIKLPAKQAEMWINTELVQLTEEQTLDDTDTLKILIEKDFACLTPREGEVRDFAKIGGALFTFVTGFLLAKIEPLFDAQVVGSEPNTVLIVALLFGVCFGVGALFVFVGRKYWQGDT